MSPHVWFKYRALPWLVCKFCGLVRLRNESTERAVRRGCEQ
jgi:hypothetical protein